MIYISNNLGLPGGVKYAKYIKGKLSGSNPKMNLLKFVRWNLLSNKVSNPRIEQTIGKKVSGRKNKYVMPIYGITMKKTIANAKALVICILEDKY
jgi:hypothetical protein